MELYVNTSISSFAGLLEAADFQIVSHRAYQDGILKDGWNRHHVHFAELEGGVYADMHYDKRIHFMFMGVDRKKRPAALFRTTIEPLLLQENIFYKIVRSDD